MGLPFVNDFLNVVLRWGFKNANNYYRHHSSSAGDDLDETWAQSLWTRPLATDAYTVQPFIVAQSSMSERTVWAIYLIPGDLDTSAVEPVVCIIYGIQDSIGI